MSTRTRTALLLTVAAVASLGIVQAVRDTTPAMPGETETGAEFRTPEAAQEVPRPAPLRVDSFQVHRIGEGSHLGAPGELLLTFWGQGFLLTARAPQVLVGDRVTLDRTEINGDGTQLFVAVPAEAAEQLRRTGFETVTVANPGGVQELGRTRVSVPATPDRLLSPAPDAPPVRLVYEDGAFRREPAR